MTTFTGGGANEVITPASVSFTVFPNFLFPTSGAGNDWLTGAATANRILGGAANASINGLGGVDSLIGGTGLYLLTGGSGADRLLGGTGQDILIGRLGQDNFVFATADNALGLNADIIRGGAGAIAFEGVGAAVVDRIDLQALDANLTVSGNQTLLFGGTATGPVRAINVGANSVVPANTGADAAFEFTVTINDGGVLAAAHVAADFIL